MKVFLQSIVLQLLFTPYIAWRGYGALPTNKGIRLGYLLLFALELALFFVGYIFHDSLPDSVFIPLMMVCNTWYISSIYLAMGLLALELFRLSKRKKQWIYPLLVAGVAGLMVKAYWNVADPIVRTETIHLNKGGNSGRDSLRIVLMTDQHIGEVVGKELVQQMVSLSNAQKPDIVLLGGDLIDYESRFAEDAHIEEDLRQLQAPLGVYGVLGNHEYRANRFAKLRWFEKTGMCLLVDSVVQPDSSFYLIGRDDRTNKRRSALHPLVSTLDRSKPLIVLDHQPMAFAETAMNKIDLALHGHTHGGQLWPNTLVVQFAFEHAYGLYKKGETQFFISCGIGCAGPPYRIGTRSELVVLNVVF